MVGNYKRSPKGEVRARVSSFTTSTWHLTSEPCQERGRESGTERKGEGDKWGEGEREKGTCESCGRRNKVVLIHGWNKWGFCLILIEDLKGGPAKCLRGSVGKEACHTNLETGVQSPGLCNGDKVVLGSLQACHGTSPHQVYTHNTIINKPKHEKKTKRV